MPATRSECRDMPRPCPHVKCRWHLWLVEGHDRVGRPRKNRPAESTLRPVWMEWPLPPSCALDIAESVLPGTTKASENHTTTAIGGYLGVKKNRVLQILHRALEKLRAHQAELGGNGFG